MKIFFSIFAVTITVFFFFSLFSVAYSWILYFSATIHKDYMFLFCNSLLVFICLISHSSSVSPTKDYLKRGIPGSNSSSSRIVGGVGDEKDMGLLHVVQVRDDHEKAGETETLSVLVEETCGDDYVEEVAGDDKTIIVNVEETRDDELEAVEDDTTQDDALEVVEDVNTLSETQDHELEVVLEVEEYQTLSVIDETRGEEEQGGSIDKISTEELNKRCEEFIRKMKEDIRVEILTIQCH